MKKVDFNKLQAGDLVEVPRTQFAPMRRGWNGWLFSEAVVIRKGEPAAEGSRLIAAICIPWKNSGGHTSQKVCGRSTGFQLLFNAKSSPHGKTKRQNRRAAHMERQRAPPKGREAKNGSRGIDSRGRIPERLCRCNGRYAQKKGTEAAAGAGKESPPLVFH